MLRQQQRRTSAARTEAEELVLTTIAQHADALLRTARRHSLCADDASDAYQRGLEIFLRNAGRVDASKAAAWLHTVVEDEALSLLPFAGRWLRAVRRHALRQWSDATAAGFARRTAASAALLSRS